MNNSDIKNKAVRGVTWNLIERFGIQIIRLTLGIVLARLLSPEEFGVMGVVMVFVLVAQVFIDSGFGQAYVQKNNVTDEDANTVFFTNLGVSIILLVALWLLAPLISKFYESPMLASYLRVMGFVMIINAFNVIQVAKLTRAINFKNKSIITLGSVLLAGAMGVIAAWKGFGVWSLIIQHLSERLFITLGLWFKSKWRPGFVFSKDSFKEMFKFGAWILLSGVVTKLFENIYVLVIGKLFPMDTLGYYSQSKKFQRITTQQITGAIGVVTFPIFAQAQSNLPVLKNRIKKFLQHTLIFIVPLLTTFAIVAEPFVLILLTDKWAPMIPFLRLLCVAGLLYPINVVNVKVLLAIGKSRLNFLLTLFKNLLRIINIVITAKYGVVWIIVGEITITFLAMFINTFFIEKYVKYGLWGQLKDTWKFYVSAMIAASFGYILILFIENQWLLFVLGILTVFGVYLLLQVLFNKEVLMESIQLKNTLTKNMNKNFKKKNVE